MGTFEGNCPLDTDEIKRLIETNKGNPKELYKVFGDGEIIGGVLTHDNDPLSAVWERSIEDMPPVFNLIIYHKSEMVDILAWYLKASLRACKETTPLMCQVVWDLLSMLHPHDEVMDKVFSYLSEPDLLPIVQKMTDINQKDDKYYFLTLFRREDTDSEGVFKKFSRANLGKLKQVSLLIEDGASWEHFTNEMMMHAHDSVLDHWLLEARLQEKALLQLRKNLDAYFKGKGPYQDNPTTPWDDFWKRRTPHFFNTIEKDMMLKEINTGGANDTKGSNPSKKM